MNKDPKKAVLLSFLLPGAGHLYLKRYFDGITLAAVSLFIWYILLVARSFFFTRGGKALVVSGAQVFLYLYAAIDVYLKARKAK